MLPLPGSLAGLNLLQQESHPFSIYPPCCPSVTLFLLLQPQPSTSTAGSFDPSFLLTPENPPWWGQKAHQVERANRFSALRTLQQAHAFQKKPTHSLPLGGAVFGSRPETACVRSGLCAESPLRASCSFSKFVSSCLPPILCSLLTSLSSCLCTYGGHVHLYV